MSGNTDQNFPDERTPLDPKSNRLTTLENGIHTLRPVDSAYSWLMAFSAAMIQFVVFGTIAIYGIYMAHYLENGLFNASKASLALIGGLGPAIYSLFALPSGIILAKMGHRVNLISGAILFAVSLVLVSFSTQVWHLFVNQALLMGIGVSLCFIPTVSITPQWFDRYRGLAMGVIAAGTGAGGLILAPVIQSLIDSIGLKWALRLNGVVGAIIVIAFAFVIEPHVEFTPPKKIFESDLIKDSKFIVFWGMGFVLCFGYWIPLHLLPLYCRYYSIPASTASFITGLISGSSAVGRILLGRISDKFGNINTLIVCNLLVSLSFVLIWNFATEVWSLVIFAVTFGFFSGGFFALSALIAPQLFGLEKLAKVNGLFYTSSTPGYALGTMIATVIISSNTHGDYVNYLPSQVYAASCYLLSCVFLIWLKFQQSNKLFDKV